MDKITLLQAMLNSEDDCKNLLDKLNSYAKSKDSYEYGLPLYNESQEHMVLIIKEWLCQLVLKV